MVAMKSVVNSPRILGQCIRRARKNKNLSQQEAGSPFKLDQTTISSIEQGAAGTRIETLFRLLAALDLELVIQDKKIDYEKAEW